MLTRKQQEVLLELAKTSLTYYLKNKKSFNPEDFIHSKLEQEGIKKVSAPAGVFVTLRKDKELRGCIGTIEGKKAIYKNVNDYAVLAGVKDNRFPPVESSELPDIGFEISVLTEPKKIKSIDEIVLGRHGVIIEKDQKSAVYLPEVPIDWNWNKTQLLENLCKKAGLPKESYKEKDAILKVFEAEVFEKNCIQTEKLKKAEFAGKFYPQEESKLNQMLDYFLNQDIDKSYQTKAIIVPHAGYLYSGKTAGVPYQSLAKNKKLKTIVIVAPSHNLAFDGIIYGCFNIFETPLGQIKVDTNTLNKIKNLENITEGKEKLYEHSLEVQLPFIQKIFGEEIGIVPFISGETEPQLLASVINDLWEDESVGFVFSTDLSHYLTKSECEKTDANTIKLIEEKDYESLKRDMLCGYNVIRGVLKFAKDKGLKIINVSQSDSSEHSGDESQVVGYAGFVMVEE